MAKIKLDLIQTPKGKGIITLQDLTKNELILEFEKNYVDYPTNKTLRLGEKLYQLSNDPDALENFINHSCEPNAFVDYESLQLIALKDIKQGEEITYNYFTSDWDGEDVFECLCGSEKCVKVVSGFKNLSAKNKNFIKNLISPFLKRKSL